MIVKLKRIDGVTELFHTGNFAIAPAKQTHPDIMSITVMTDDGTMIHYWRRPAQRWYKKHGYKPAQQELQPVQPTEGMPQESQPAKAE